jgi:hypothetical protein
MEVGMWHAGLLYNWVLALQPQQQIISHTFSEHHLECTCLDSVFSGGFHPYGMYTQKEDKR